VKEFSLSSVGLVAQVDFTLENDGGTMMATRAGEKRDKGYWWQVA
jgi:hypothetical protein